MILVAGGTSRVGRELVRLLHGRPIRVLTRNVDRAKSLGVDVAVGDVRDRASIDRAMLGVRCVVSSIHGFAQSDVSPKTVDELGNANLIESARRAGVDRFVLVSVHGVSPDHAMDLFVAKWAAEETLRASGLRYSIVRPTAFIETWLELLGTPLAQRGRTTIFGRGENPINFVSAADVARVVAAEVDEQGDRLIELAGPENLSFRALLARFCAITGVTGTIGHVPLPVMRASAWLMWPLRPSLARLIRAGVVMDTTDMTSGPSSGFSPTTVDAAIRRFVER